ncbi:MAG: TIGR01906 family membrane protein [Chloroflexota bacterium]
MSLEASAETKDEKKTTKTKTNGGAAIYRALGWLVTVLVPVALVLTGVRAMLSSPFLYFEYNTPNFPEDPYGFTKEERLYWSHIALDYLVNDAGIEFLGDLRFADNTPVYNERELHHMVDVKNAIRTTLRVWYLSLGLLLLLGVWAWRANWLGEYWRGMGRGGWLTAIMLVTVIAFVLASFGIFFVAFHNVFFEEGTWLFYYSDTLIRLFPERFWRDIFIYVGAFALIVGLALGWGLRKRG